MLIFIDHPSGSGIDQRSAMMRAHTEPEAFARWVGPNGVATTILDWDATTGDRWPRSVAASGMGTGIEEGYAKLDALIAEL